MAEINEMYYHGKPVGGGGGEGIIPMTKAEYLANKEYLDQTDLTIFLTDDDLIGDAQYIECQNGQNSTNLQVVGNIALNSIGKVEFTDTALYPHAVGDYFINKDGEYCKCISAISVGQTLTKNTNYVVTDVGSEIKGINDGLSEYVIARFDNGWTETFGSGQGCLQLNSGHFRKSGYTAVLVSCYTQTPSSIMVGDCQIYNGILYITYSNRTDSITTGISVFILWHKNND